MAVAMTVGIGRYAWGESNIFNSRYATAAVPPLLGAYFVWELCGPSKLVPLGRMVYFSIVCGFLSLNYQLGRTNAEYYHEAALAFEKDRSAGMCIPELISRHSAVTYYYHDRLETWLRQLRDAHVEEYRQLPPDPQFREQSLPVTRAVPNAIKWNGREGEVFGPDGYLQFDLDETRFVCGLRIHFACSDRRNMSPVFKVSWARDDGSELAQYRQYDIPPSGEESNILIYIYNKIKSVRVYPNNRPSEFRISSISALLPEEADE